MIAALWSMCAICGLVTLSRHPVTALWLTLRVALGIALWAGLWRMASATMAGAPWLTDVPTDPLSTLAVNAGLATATACPVAIALWLTARAADLGGAHGLVWAAGLIAPQLGQNGAWPVTSLALALWVALLSLGLGRLAVKRRG